MSNQSAIVCHLGSTNATCGQLDFYFRQRNDNLRNAPPPLKTVLLAVYTVVAVVGSVGNSLVILAVLRNAKLRSSVRNCFIAQLAFSDFVMCTLTVPFTVKFTFERHWALGDYMCRTVAALQGVNVFVSTMSITAISLDRYVMLLLPANQRAQRAALVGSFVTVWFVAAAMGLPLFLSTGLSYAVNESQWHKIEQCCGFRHMVCQESSEGWFQEYGRQLYTFGCFLFQYLLPLTGLAFMNARISDRLKQHATYRASIQKHNRESVTRILRRQTKLNRLIGAVVATFATTWLPFNVYQVVVIFAPAVLRHNYILPCMHVIAMLSACSNPLLYGLLNENFRQEFAIMFGCVRWGLVRVKRDSAIPASAADPQLILLSAIDQQLACCATDDRHRADDTTSHIRRSSSGCTRLSSCAAARTEASAVLADFPS